MKFLLIIFLLMIFPTFVQAEEKNAAAQKAIDACWAVSQEYRDSGVTAKMREGHLNTALCMEDHIIYLSENYLYKDRPKLVDETKERLEMLRAGYGRIYWNLFNSHDECRTILGCGTLYHIFHNNYYAVMLESIIKDHYLQIEKYELSK